jgi:hypothetical protein
LQHTQVRWQHPTHGAGAWACSVPGLGWPLRRPGPGQRNHTSGVCGITLLRRSILSFPKRRRDGRSSVMSPSQLRAAEPLLPVLCVKFEAVPCQIKLAGASPLAGRGASQVAIGPMCASLVISPGHARDQGGPGPVHHKIVQGRTQPSCCGDPGPPRGLHVEVQGLHNGTVIYERFLNLPNVFLNHSDNYRNYTITSTHCHCRRHCRRPRGVHTASTRRAHSE